MSAPKIESVTTVYEGWGRLLKVDVASPQDGRRFTREVEDHGDAVAVLAYDPGRKTALLVRQLRVPMLLTAGEPDGLEAIAGLLDGDEPADCARREADEEAGLALSVLDPVAVIWSMPGISTERIHLFLGSYSAPDRRGSGGGLAAENENITVSEMPLSALASMADEGRLQDAKTMLLVQTLRLRRPDLFAP